MSRQAEAEYREWIRSVEQNASEQLAPPRGHRKRWLRGPLQSTHAAMGAGRDDGHGNATGGPTGPPVSVHLGGVHFAYHLPDHGKVRGVFLFLHCCGRHALDWFFAGGAGSGLVIGGLPEESIMTSAVLGRGFAAVAADAQGSCWQPHVDGPSLADGLQQLRLRLGLAQAPIYGVGTSSGGIMLAALHLQFIPLQGLVFNVSPGAHDPRLLAGAGVTRAFFVHMPPDDWAPPHLIEAAATVLRHGGATVQTKAVQARPIADFANRAAWTGMPLTGVEILQKRLESWGLTELRGEPPRRYLVLNGAAGASNKLLGEAASSSSQGATVPPIKLRMIRRVIAELHTLEGTHAPTAEDFESQVLPFLLQGAL